ncbi:MAG: NAD(+)/NADH kinase [Candidatus Bathyarchaeia archaeon]
MFRRIGIISRKDREEALRKVSQICDHLLEKGVEVFLEGEVSELLGRPGLGCDLREVEVDLVVTVGGDGTILRSSSLLKRPETPLLAVNMGMRGFLTEVEPEEALEAIDRVFEGDYALEEHFKLSSTSKNSGEVFQDALNEVLVSSSLPSKTLRLRLYADGVEVFDIQADGIIVATPTGSTAYSLSAGGSILAPSVEAMIVTTLYPLSPFRSMVVPLMSVVEVELTKPECEALVVVDGMIQGKMRQGDRVAVWRSDHKATFIRFQSFYSRLKNRLLFPYKGNRDE